MKLVVSKERIRHRMRGSGYSNYRVLAQEATKRGLNLSEGTLYNMENSSNWSATRLAALCEMLNCKPIDLIEEWNGSDDHHTQESPRSEEELQGTT